MRAAGLLAWLMAAGALLAGEAAAPDVALARLRYYAGGDEFVIRSPQGVKAIVEWLAQVEKGPDSQHARTGACDRDAELELYAAASDARPARVVELFTSCNHALNKEVTAAQFAALRKVAEEMGERLLVIRERDNGKTLDAKVGQPIEVRLVGDQAGAGWEADAPKGGAVQEDATLPQRLFTPKPGAEHPAIGTYTFRYRAVKRGEATLRIFYVTPGGPGAPRRRRATALNREFIVTVRVAAPPEKAGTL